MQLMNSAYKHHVKEIKMLSKLNQNVSWESWSWSPLPSLLPHVEAVVSMSSLHLMMLPNLVGVHL